MSLIFLAILAMAGSDVAAEPASPPALPIISVPLPPPPSPQGSAANPIPLGNPGGWIMTSDYPIEALRRSSEGVARFRLTIEPAGLVSRCDITGASGDPSLDEATCRLITQRASFAPATDTRGRAVQSTYESRVRWTIPQEKRHPVPSLLVRTFISEKDGSMSNCRIERSEGGPAMMRPVGTEVCPYPKVGAPYLDASGNPVRKLIRITESVNVEDLRRED